jgi:hypothetical protein
LTIASGLALVLVAFAATPVAGSSGAAAAAAKAEHDRIVAYWTPARLASAVPRERQFAGSPIRPNAKPPGTPGGGGGGGGTGGDVTGASWTNGGPILDLTGKVYFSLSGGNWQCSGSIVTDSNRPSYSLVLTAGHCVSDESTGQFATNWMFIPNWDSDPASFSTACNSGTTLRGCWTASALVAHDGFINAGSFNQSALTHDWGFAVVGQGGYSNTQLDALGSLGIQFSLSNGTRVDSFGYPAARPYSGNDLTYCAGNVFQDAGTGNATWGLNCNMTGGSSGGPWIAGFSESSGSGGNATSVNSYKYNGDKNHMYGPKFNANTSATWTAAKSATNSNVIVP